MILRALDILPTAPASSFRRRIHEADSRFRHGSGRRPRDKSRRAATCPDRQRSAAGSLPQKRHAFVAAVQHQLPVQRVVVAHCFTCRSVQASTVRFRFLTGPAARSVIQLSGLLQTLNLLDPGVTAVCNVGAGEADRAIRLVKFLRPLRAVHCGRKVGSTTRDLVAVHPIAALVGPPPGAYSTRHPGTISATMSASSRIRKFSSLRPTLKVSL